MIGKALLSSLNNPIIPKIIANGARISVYPVKNKAIPRIPKIIDKIPNILPLNFT